MQKTPLTRQNIELLAENQVQTPQKLSRNGFFGLLCILLLASVIRIWPVVASGWVVGDGGLFWNMTRAVEQGKFVLPSSVNYPTATPSIPLGYPPLGFYLGALGLKLGLAPEAVFRVLPVLWSILAVWFFWRLARTFCEREWPALAAALLCSLFFYGFAWNVQGGGLTRAPALCFALGAIEATLRLWKTENNRALGEALFWLTLALVTHLERAHLAVVTLFLVWGCFGRTRKSFFQLLVIGLGSLLLSSPWWGLCLSRFGVEPFEAALRSGAVTKTYSFAFWTGEPFLPLVHLVALGGLLLCLKRKEWFLPLWLVAIIFLEARSLRSFAIFPISLAAGLALEKSGRFRLVWAAMLGAWLCLGDYFAIRNLPMLSGNERTAMSWVRAHTPPTAAFLVIPQDEWATDLRSEWFPSLAERASIATVQGSEWLPRERFARRVAAHNQLRQCHDWGSVEAWSISHHAKYEWLWLEPKKQGPLHESLQRAGGWKVAYVNGQVEIWHRY